MLHLSKNFIMALSRVIKTAHFCNRNCSKASMLGKKLAGYDEIIMI